jgi:hypothetical protein
MTTRQNDPGSRRAALEGIPVKNPGVREKKQADDELMLIYSVQVKPWFSGIFKKVAGRESRIINRKLQLDSLGISVWHLLDGKRSVRQIISIFQKNNQLHAREAEVAVTQFLRELGQRSLIAIREEPK